MAAADSNAASYTVKITIHGAQNVPIADVHNLSADPYVLARIVASSRSQAPDEPSLHWRTPTARCTRDPVFEDSWLVGGVPQDGFVLELSVVDEDARNSDDRLGKAEAHFTREMMHEGFEIIRKALKMQKRRGSVVPYMTTYLASLLPGQRLRKHNRVVISMKVLGKTKEPDARRIYTLGPNAYTQHFSPLIGSVVNRSNRLARSSPKQETGNKDKPVSALTLVANKLQLTGPVPKELRHHYVGYNLFIKWLYSNRGIAGRLLNKSLRKQYRTIYSYDKSTRYGVVDAKDVEASGDETSADAQYISPTETNAFARRFLSLVKYGVGGRLNTYVLTLDAQWRFSETGDDFAIDFLSKHMMHADGAPIVAYAGEFFVRRISSGDKHREEEGSGDDETDDNPAHYELIIDNDSGTYRPPKETLPTLQAWLEDDRRLGGLGRVTAMHCFDDKLQEMKCERKKLRKRLTGGQLQKHQIAERHGSSASSLRAGEKKKEQRGGRAGCSGSPEK